MSRTGEPNGGIIGIMSGAPISENGRDGITLAIAGKKSELGLLCRQFHVVKLELFGSATGTSFDPERSDLDFLVEFEALMPREYAAAFFEFKEELERLFGRSVDLVVSSAIRNPYFRQSVEKSKTLLYAA